MDKQTFQATCRTLSPQVQQRKIKGWKTVLTQIWEIRQQCYYYYYYYYYYYSDIVKTMANGTEARRGKNQEKKVLPQPLTLK